MTWYFQLFRDLLDSFHIQNTFCSAWEYHSLSGYLSNFSKYLQSSLVTKDSSLSELNKIKYHKVLSSVINYQLFHFYHLFQELISFFFLFVLSKTTIINILSIYVSIYIDWTSSLSSHSTHLQLHMWLSSFHCQPISGVLINHLHSFCLSFVQIDEFNFKLNCNRNLNHMRRV